MAELDEGSLLASGFGWSPQRIYRLRHLIGEDRPVYRSELAKILGISNRTIFRWEHSQTVPTRFFGKVLWDCATAVLTKEELADLVATGDNYPLPWESQTEQEEV